MTRSTRRYAAATQVPRVDERWMFRHITSRQVFLKVVIQFEQKESPSRGLETGPSTCLIPGWGMLVDPSRSPSLARLYL